MESIETMMSESVLFHLTKGEKVDVIWKKLLTNWRWPYLLHVLQKPSYQKNKIGNVGVINGTGWWPVDCRLVSRISGLTILLEMVKIRLGRCATVLKTFKKRRLLEVSESGVVQSIDGSYRSSIVGTVLPIDLLGYHFSKIVAKLYLVSW